MVNYIFICLVFVLCDVVSCNNAQKNETSQTTESGINCATPKNTLISYDIEEISTEGAESKVCYVNGKISRSITRLYSGSEQASVTYYFEKNRIKVIEKHYYYLTEIENVRSDEDMALRKELNYYIDFDGNVVGDVVEDDDRTDFFRDFKKKIPFKID